MKVQILKTMLIAVGLTVYGSYALAQTPQSDAGRREFEGNCSSCHGGDGKGNGPLVEFLRRSPPDLTQLAKANNGVFPISRLYGVIEGGSIASHGSRDMPVWGREYRIEDAKNLLEARGNYDAETLVRIRILTLLEYINRIQAR